MKVEISDRLVAQLVAHEIALERLRDEMMTTKEVASFLSVAQGTVSKLPIKRVNCRNGRRYRRSDVEAYLESRTITFPV